MKRLIYAFCTMVIVALGGCGGGGSSVSGSGSGTTTLSGVVVKGYFVSGTVMAYSLENGAIKSLIGSASITGQGGYQLSYSGYAGPVLLVATGRYTDEITNKTLPETGDIILQAALPSAAGALSANITPLTELAVRKAGAREGALTAANIGYGNDLIENLFKVSDILSVTPVAYSLTALQGATTEAREYTLVLAAISRMSVSSATTATAVIGSLFASLAGDIMTSAMATELGAAISAVNSTNLLLDDLNSIGGKTIGITFRLSASSPNISGFQFTLQVPASHYIPTLSASKEVPEGSVIGIGQIGRDDIYAGFDGTTRELTVVWGNLTPISSGDVLTIYFKLDPGVSHPPPASEGYFYKDLIVSDRYLNEPIPGATLSARDSATGGALNLSLSIN